MTKNKNTISTLDNQNPNNETPPHREIAAKDTSSHRDASEQLNNVLNVFLGDLQSVQRTNVIVMPHVLTWLRDQHNKNATKLESFKVEADEAGKKFYKTTGVHSVAELLAATRDMQSLGGARIVQTLQRSLFTQIFCEFDSFIGALLKVIYTNQADLLKGIAREITFADLLTYENLNAIKLDMLDKEIDSFRRDSYIEQFTTLENKFKFKTLRDFEEWGEFVELSQRRNLLVHNGGRISEQYVLICDREGYKFDARPVLGEMLKITPLYFSRAIIVMSKVAFMLTHTLWRKVFPNEFSEAHQSANDTLYELLKDKRWKTGAEIAKFCLNDQMCKNISDIDLRVRTVNAAIAAKFSGSASLAKSYLDSIDWSASYRDFKLAISILNDEYSNAAEIMKSIGKNGELINELSYHEWPLFHKFRETPEFLDAYQDIYGISFVKEAVRHSAEEVQKNKSEFEDSHRVKDVGIDTHSAVANIDGLNGSI